MDVWIVQNDLHITSPYKFERTMNKCTNKGMNKQTKKLLKFAVIRGNGSHLLVSDVDVHA